MTRALLSVLVAPLRAAVAVIDWYIDAPADPWMTVEAPRG